MAANVATATPPITLTICPLAIVATVTLCYLWLCWERPFRRCPLCHGTGWTTTAVLRRPRICRRCHGQGWRLRHGRRLYNHLRHLNRAAHNAERSIWRRVS